MGQDVFLNVERLSMPGVLIDAFGISPTQATGTVQTLASTNAVTIGQNQSIVRVTAAGAVTGITLPLGTRPGQLLVVIHEGAAANTLTFAAAGTSNVAGGATAIWAGLNAHMVVWDSITALWYQVGPVSQ